MQTTNDNVKNVMPMISSSSSLTHSSLSRLFGQLQLQRLCQPSPMPFSPAWLIEEDLARPQT